MSRKRSILGFTSAALGIISFVPIYGTIFGVVAIILGSAELYRINDGKSIGPKSSAYQGIVLGFFGGMISLAIALSLGAK